MPVFRFDGRPDCHPVAASGVWRIASEATGNAETETSKPKSPKQAAVEDKNTAEYFFNDLAEANEASNASIEFSGRVADRCGRKGRERVLMNTCLHLAKPFSPYP